MSWFTDFDNGRLHVMLGSKGSGKTFSVLATMRKAILEKAYDHYYCIIPAIHSEEDGSYKWLMMYPDLITFHDDWHPDFISQIAAKQEKAAKKRDSACTPQERARLDDKMDRVFVFIDDATGYGEEMTTDNNFIRMCVMLRHWHITMFVCVHTLKAVLRPTIRNTVDRLTIGKLTNSALLEGVYTEYISLMKSALWDSGNKKDFIRWFIENVNASQDFNMLTLSLRTDDAPPGQTAACTNTLKFISDFAKEIPRLDEKYWDFKKHGGK